MRWKRFGQLQVTCLPCLRSAEVLIVNATVCKLPAVFRYAVDELFLRRERSAEGDLYRGQTHLLKLWITVFSTHRKPERLHTAFTTRTRTEWRWWRPQSCPSTRWTISRSRTVYACVRPQPSCRPIKHNICPCHRAGVPLSDVRVKRCRPPKHPSYLRHRAGVPPTDVCVERCRLLKHVSHDCHRAGVPPRDVHVERCRPPKHLSHVRHRARVPSRDVRVEICRKPEHGVHARHSADVPRVHVTRLTRRVVDEAGIDSGFQVLTFNLQFEVKSTTSFSWYRRKTDFSKI